MGDSTQKESPARKPGRSELENQAGQKGHREVLQTKVTALSQAWEESTVTAAKAQCGTLFLQPGWCVMTPAVLPPSPTHQELDIVLGLQPLSPSACHQHEIQGRSSQQTKCGPPAHSKTGSIKTHQVAFAPWLSG